MTRLDEINEFLEHDYKKNAVIEPEHRYDVLKERIFEIIETCNPRVIVKAGLGNGKLIFEIAEKYDSYFVVVESSFMLIKEFLAKYEGNSVLEKIRFINGDFTNFPVDYYAADLLLSIDFLDFIESGRAIDEFRRAIQFDSMFFIASVVLNDEDIEGAYDDFMRILFPLHNDYYLKSDLNTVLDLNEFRCIKDKMLYFDEDLKSKIEYFKELYSNPDQDPDEFILNNKEVFDSHYKMNDGIISVPYYMGLFSREKPNSPKGKIV